MEERRDQAIKLFGKMIPLQGSGEDSIGAGEEENKLQQRVPEKQLAVQSISLEKIDPLIPPPTKSENGAKPEAKEAENEKQRKPNGDQDEETAARKPDKIVPCPRCDSLDTKFCYFNNYNVSQPRHFCKNCQRYWTAGGSSATCPSAQAAARPTSPPMLPGREFESCTSYCRPQLRVGLAFVRVHGLGSESRELRGSELEPIFDDRLELDY
uniref:Dof-type domain-containing protein n=1 Tax=Ananas comosus var. bracteatus TaxID=296719 RepID=A0A6V7P2W8_ANACO|nr:unnamed protein product [Ananas comosus var. bracteatus]